eukprot:5984957-Pleurochrysis_carterae.AAC.2
MSALLRDERRRRAGAAEQCGGCACCASRFYGTRQKRVRTFWRMWLRVGAPDCERLRAGVHTCAQVRQNAGEYVAACGRVRLRANACILLQLREGESGCSWVHLGGCLCVMRRTGALLRLSMRVCSCRKVGTTAERCMSAY